MGNYVSCVAIETWDPSSSYGGDLHETHFQINEREHLERLSTKQSKYVLKRAES